MLVLPTTVGISLTRPDSVGFSRCALPSIFGQFALKQKSIGGESTPPLVWTVNADTIDRQKPQWTKFAKPYKRRVSEMGALPPWPAG
jgi:hypothetical protein